MPNPPPALSVTDAVKNSHAQFHKSLFSNSDLTALERKRANTFVQDPFWRPLCELEVNGATTYEGALLLLASKLISSTSFRVRRGHSAGSFVECVDFTDAGLQLFNEYAGQEIDDGLRERLITSLMSYAAIDTGNGIVARVIPPETKGMRK
jgi:hypothetical protein